MYKLPADHFKDKGYFKNSSVISWEPMPVEWLLSE